MRARKHTVISGAHVVLYSNDATADRAFLRDVLGFASVDAGHGWLIFALPPAEVAVHPADPPSGEQNPHELYFLCDDLKSELEGLRQKGVQCSDVREVKMGFAQQDSASQRGRDRSLSAQAPNRAGAARQVTPGTG
jgi:catechol 2,3-dioxygenase-like lactoylglutathione lyase family enzyme